MLCHRVFPFPASLRVGFSGFPDASQWLLRRGGHNGATIRHAQLFAYNLDGIKLRDVDKAFLATYFDELGRCDNIVAWRFRQAVSAVEMVFEMLETNPEVLRSLGRLRDIMRFRNLAIRTEQTYSDWAERFARFCKGPFPEDPQRVVAFLEHLALEEKVAPATQAQALNALVFLYKHILKRGKSGRSDRPRPRMLEGLLLPRGPR